MGCSLRTCSHDLSWLVPDDLPAASIGPLPDMGVIMSGMGGWCWWPGTSIPHPGGHPEQVAGWALGAAGTWFASATRGLNSEVY